MGNTNSFTVNEDFVEAEVYGETISGGAKTYLVKIKLLEIQTYITGIRVQRSPKRPEEGLWVQMPAVKVGWQWKKIIEYAGGSPFFEIVERKAREAVNHYELMTTSSYALRDEVVEVDVNKPINLDDIPF